MRAALEKMFYKGQSRLLVLNPPPEAKSLAKAFGREELTPPRGKATFVLAYAPDPATAIKAAKTVAKNLQPGGIFWMAYPKTRPNKRKPALNQDSLHALMASLGFMGNSLVALDGNWSAMRFKGM